VVLVSERRNDKISSNLVMLILNHVHKLTNVWCCKLAFDSLVKWIGSNCGIC
jgi:hypothetical protein